MPAVNILMKPASSMCSMSCDYCFYCDEAKKRTQESFGFMSEETLENIIRRTLPYASEGISYAYQGGEPTLRGLTFYKKAVEYQKQYNTNQIPVQNSLQTNGFTLDEEWCRFFQKEHFLIGLSVDGTRNTHDMLRHSKSGAGTFDRILESAKLLDHFQVDYNILTVVTPEIVEHVSEIYQDYQKRGWNYQQYIACLEPLGEGHKKHAYALPPQKYGTFLTTLFKLWYADLLDGRQPYIRQFENYVRLAAGYMAEACDQRGICGIQNVVEADGSVYPCDFYMLDEYLLGNLNEDSLEKIYKKRKETGFIERSLKLDSRCSSCRYYRLCRGGCQRNRDFNPDTGLYENYFCESYQMFFDECYEKILEIGQAVR